MESQTDAISAQTDDTEANMRRNLGINSPSRSDDPLKAARQTIRSQVTAREYTERQLVQAQATIQDLRSRIHHLRQEKDAAVSAAHSAIAARDTAERILKAAEAATAARRAARDRSDRALQDAETTIKDLREKLARANHDLQTMRAERAAERPVEQEVVDPATVAIMAPEVTAPADQGQAAVTKVRRPVGRPRKVAVVQDIITPASREEAAVTKVRKPVGRPRKVAAAVPSPRSAIFTSTADKPKAAKPSKPARPVETGGPEPVQWWVPGWRER